MVTFYTKVFLVFFKKIDTQEEFSFRHYYLA